MSKLGKALLIFGLIAFTGAVLFGISVAAFGVKNADYGISIGNTNIPFFNIGGFNMSAFIPGDAGIHFVDGTDFNGGATRINEDFETNREYTYTFDASQLTSVEIGLASCKAGIVCSESSKAEIRYTTGTMKVNFSAVMSNDTLTITEKPGSWFNLGGFKSSELTLSLPKKQYESLKLDLASGSINGSDLTADSLKAEVASGSVELGVFADNIDCDIASGKMILTNCTDKTANGIDIDAASGSVTMNGFKADSTNIDLASGSVTLGGISGTVDADLASGKVTLVYAEWNDDLNINLMSGKADVTLPEGSGADVNFEKASGSINISLDGENVSLSKNGSATVGGSNVQNVKAHTMSGSISIHN